MITVIRQDECPQRWASLIGLEVCKQFWNGVSERYAGCAIRCYQLVAKVLLQWLHQKVSITTAFRN
tara:strand:+ start:23 stop:220 length:198 start_codon:yes stop_codon:yes gene_type:complete